MKTKFCLHKVKIVRFNQSQSTVLVKFGKCHEYESMTMHSNLNKQYVLLMEIKTTYFII